MRLSKIKLSGFKSFVDPTTIEFTSNLTGIVGPNGCGKSNTIDAVRWVMGESSAKHLRGSTMDDVIFNGSSSRKPIGQASVELVFDNKDGSLGGEYSQYAEIAIKRLVTRDGQSKYFLNNARCRRKDITDIFLGTGLGPRSYAIIEQGMISRLIEAKPEELRVYLEEAAGISKYRSRRRETETRIRHTRENLDRLQDLRDEIEKHLKQLKRQSNAALRFKEYKQQQRQHDAELLFLQRQEVQQKVQKHESTLAKQGLVLEESITLLRQTEKDLELQREQQQGANDTQNETQARFYKIGAEIASIEQAIKHQKDAKQRYEQQLQHVEQELMTNQQHLAEDKQKVQIIEDELAEVAEKKLAFEEEFTLAQLAMQEAEQAQQQWQTQWSEHQHCIAEPRQKAQVERAKMQQLERQLQQTTHRLDKIDNIGLDQDITRLTAQMEQQQASLLVSQQDYQDSDQQRIESKDSLIEWEDKQQSLRQSLDKKRAEHQRLTGRQASLTALQQAGLGKDNHKTNHWLKQHGLSDQMRLGEVLAITEKWQTALEVVLAEQLEAIKIDQLDTLKEDLDSPPKHLSLNFVSDESNNSNDYVNTAIQLSLLQTHLTENNPMLSPLLSGIYCADDLSHALAQRKQLQNNESIITAQGLWIGVNWLKMPAGDKQKEGVINRNQELTQLDQSIVELNQQISDESAESDQYRQQIRELQAQQGDVQQRHNELYRQQSHIENQLKNTQQRIEQTEQQQSKANTDTVELREELTSLQLEHQLATKERNRAVSELEQLSITEQNLAEKEAPLKQAHQDKQQDFMQCQSLQQEATHQQQSLTQQAEQTGAQILRSEERDLILMERQEELKFEFETAQPTEDQQPKLEILINQHHQCDKELQLARTALQEIDHQINQLNQQRSRCEGDIEKNREGLDQLRLQWQESTVRFSTLDEQLADTEYDLKALENDLPEGSSIVGHKQALEQLQQRIQRLGAINLAAIDEYEQERERKTFLDTQNNDLTTALDTLESAISKIDRDTRNRFKETFNKVNTQLQEMFPRLFGGGKAYLEMTDNNLLTTGIMIMAQPPGKKISNIHLMSGGEKALTAAALVFAIFQLNPAPFCMLDEVDAPLDEANVRRFARLIQMMSEHIQFIFITHNKSTMEVAENLVGVTMRELGVSRTVSVNVSDAVTMSQG
ncbi:MAG: chromosome segregation protein SMC [Thiotrichaceae bacterium]|nr:chromosome segregation protein SMC [Thiotrichaceae bacterium]